MKNDDAKNESVTVRLSRIEKSKLAEKARTMNISTGQYIRQCIGASQSLDHYEKLIRHTVKKTVRAEIDSLNRALLIQQQEFIEQIFEALGFLKPQQQESKPQVRR